jgi:hypothetical protein
MSKARCMALGKAVGAKALDLLEHPLGELEIIAPPHHAADEPFVINTNTLRVLEGRHGPSKLVGLTRREAGGDNRHAHRLLLEERNSERAAENLFEFVRIAMLRGGAWINRLLEIPTPAQIGMDHIALDWTGADDRNLHNQVVELARPKARQHRHLRPAFDLEHAEGPGRPRKILNRLMSSAGSIRSSASQPKTGTTYETVVLVLKLPEILCAFD